LLSDAATLGDAIAIKPVDGDPFGHEHESLSGGYWLRTGGPIPGTGNTVV
jgi:hypothetical protein